MGYFKEQDIIAQTEASRLKREKESFEHEMIKSDMEEEEKKAQEEAEFYADPETKENQLTRLSNELFEVIGMYGAQMRKVSKLSLDLEESVKKLNELRIKMTRIQFEIDRLEGRK